MFQKFHLAFYNMLFVIYGEFATYYAARLKEEWTDHEYYERRFLKCVTKRKDILRIMYVQKGL
jgi:hypothetical protein